MLEKTGAKISSFVKSKNLNKMKEIIFKVEEDLIDGGYVAEGFTADNEQIVTQGENVEELKEMIKAALECHFDNPFEMPHKVILNFVRQEVFAF